MLTFLTRVTNLAQQLFNLLEHGQHYTKYRVRTTLKFIFFIHSSPICYVLWLDYPHSISNDVWYTCNSILHNWYSLHLDVSCSAEDADRQLNAAIQEQLHFMPQLIESSMQADTARQDGEDGKKYHTHAHFNVSRFMTLVWRCSTFSHTFQLLLQCLCELHFCISYNSLISFVAWQSCRQVNVRIQ